MGKINPTQVLKEALNPAERLHRYMEEAQEARSNALIAKTNQKIAEDHLLEELVSQGRIECLMVKHSTLRRFIRNHK